MRRFTVILHLLVLSALACAAIAAPLEGKAGESQSEQSIVLVAGATGRLGRYVIAALAQEGFAVRGLTRDPAAAREKYGDRYDWVAGDIRSPASLVDAIAGVDFVICAAGATTPQGPNAPQFVDYEGARNLIDASVNEGIDQFVLISSIGVTQRFHLLNLTFGKVLEWKWAAEQHLRASGLTYVIVRPGGLRPGSAGRHRHQSG
jgi:uncharacterized protein YbjT (DUF2867 family)